MRRGGCVRDSRWQHGHFGWASSVNGRVSKVGVSFFKKGVFVGCVSFRGACLQVGVARVIIRAGVWNFYRLLLG